MNPAILAATLARIHQALKPGGPVLLTMKPGEGTSTAGGGQGPLDVRALAGRGFALDFRGDGACGGGAFTNVSVLAAGRCGWGLCWARKAR